MTSAPDLSTLGADELRQLASRLLEEMRGKQALIDKLTHEMAILKRLKFAASSEAYTGEQQRVLFETLDTDIEALAAEIEQLTPTRPADDEGKKRQPKAANNAGAQTSFIPMLTLGIPSNSVMALMIGAMIIQGITPGPAVMTEQPALFWGIVASMWIGNVFLVLLNLPLVDIWVKMISVPYRFMFPAIMVFCAVGVYSLGNTTFDVYLMAIFGLFGYVCAKLRCEPAPMLLGFIIGPMLEEYLRRTMMMPDATAAVFVTRPISAALLAVAAVSMAAVMLPSLRRTREEAFQE